MRNVLNRTDNENLKNKALANKKILCILLDSGASASIIHSSYVLRNELRRNDVTNEWSTMAGTFKTTRLAEIKLKFPELSDSAEINVNCHVTKQKSNYDLILGREILRKLGINLNFLNNTTKWNDTSIPMKPVHNSTRTHFAISDSKRIASETKRIKKILDAKYEKPDINKLVNDLDYLSTYKKSKLLKLLQKYKPMFDGALGKYTGSTYKIELKEDVKPYHAKPFPIPKVHEPTLKKEVERLVEIGVLKKS